MKTMQKLKKRWEIRGPRDYDTFRPLPKRMHRVRIVANMPKDGQESIAASIGVECDVVYYHAEERQVSVSIGNGLIVLQPAEYVFITP